MPNAATSTVAQPQINPAFTEFLEGVYIVTDGSFLLSALNGGGDINEDAIQTQFKYAVGSAKTPPSVLGTTELFNLWRSSTGQIAFQTANGNFITAVDGGGLTANVIHTDAVDISTWEEFQILPTGSLGELAVAIQTHTGNFLTAVGLGGKTTNALHSDAIAVNTWETFFIRKWGGPSLNTAYFIVDTDKNQAIAASGGGGLTQNTIQFLGQSGVPLDWARFLISPQGNGSYTLQTEKGTFVTAVNGGGLDYGTSSSDNIQTNRIIASTWEQFRFIPSDDGTYLIQTFTGNFLGKRTFGGNAEGEYSTDISDPGSATKFWLVPAIFFGT
jgi:hypothetical protein